jgi:CTP:phosphocholine cytidylyltransferase-like protein
MNELIVNHKSFFVKDIPAKIRSSMEEVYASNQKGHKYIDQIIDSEIRKKFITLNKELEEVKLRWQ